MKELECCGLGKQKLVRDVITIFNCVIGCCGVVGSKLFSTSSEGMTRASLLSCCRRDQVKLVGKVLPNCTGN